MNALVSVIVPVYKVENYLIECIESIVRQTYKNLDILLIDDGSPDRCGVICDEWSTKDERIRVIHKSNGGLSDARNVGLDAARGEYIVFVDSDDWIRENMIQTLLESVFEYKAQIVACGIESCYEDHTQIWDVCEFVGGPKEALKALYHDTRYPVASWNKIYEKSLWDGIRFPRGKLYEDAFTTYLIADRATTIVQLKEPLYCYRMRSGSIMNSPFSKRNMDMEEAWRENYEYVKEKYPELKRAALDYYLVKVYQLTNQISERDIDCFQKEYDRLYGILGANRFYILAKSGLSFKLRIRMLQKYYRGKKHVSNRCDFAGI